MAQAATPYETAVLADSPLVYYRMADGAGATSAQDSSGHGITGSFFDATLGVAGPFTDAGAAASLPATGRVTADVPTVSGSAELWVNPAKLARGQEAGYIAHGDPKADGQPAPGTGGATPVDQRR